MAVTYKRFSKSIALKSLLCAFLFISYSCSGDETTPPNNSDPITTLKYLALGDSYTKGEAVCDACKFPSQLQDSLQNYLNSNEEISLKVIAQTGWIKTILKMPLSMKI